MYAALVVFLLAVIFFVTAVIGVVTGGTSLITVPVMMQCGIDAHVAVATNMLALIFLSLGGTVPFIQGQVIPRKRLPALTGLTLAGSFLGAFLLLAVPSKDMPIVVASAMLVVLIFSLIKRDMGLSKAPDSSSRSLEITGYIVTFALGVYGGFFSGGYVALLTVAYLFFFRMTFTEAVAITKVLNVFFLSDCHCDLRLAGHRRLEARTFAERRIICRGDSWRHPRSQDEQPLAAADISHDGRYPHR